MDVTKIQIRRLRIKNIKGNNKGSPKNEENGIFMRFCKSTNLDTRLLAKIDSPYDTPKEMTSAIKLLTIDSFK